MSSRDSTGDPIWGGSPTPWDQMTGPVTVTTTGVPIPCPGGLAGVVTGTSGQITINEASNYPMTNPVDEVLDELKAIKHCLKGGAFGLAFDKLCRLMPHIVDLGLAESDSNIWDRLMREPGVEHVFPGYRSNVKIQVEVEGSE